MAMARRGTSNQIINQSSLIIYSCAQQRAARLLSSVARRCIIIAMAVNKALNEGSRRFNIRLLEY